MNRLVTTAAVIFLATSAVMGQVRSNVPPAAPTPAAVSGAEPEPVSLLRIELRKASLGADAAPRVTAARAAKVKFLQDQKADAPALANAEVDLVEAQTTEQVANLNVKSVEAQLNEMLKNAASIPARQAPSATEINVLQLEVQKAKLQSDASVKIWQNRQNLLKQLQAAGADAGKIADAQADLETARASAGLMALDAEAAQARLDSALRARK